MTRKYIPHKAVLDDLSFSLLVTILLQQCTSPEQMRRKSIAMRLCTSERSLVRKLKREGCSYQNLLDAVRKDRCIRLMKQGITNSSELAHLLCYSDITSIYRAFRRWTGVSLAQAKQQLAQNPNKFVSNFHSYQEMNDSNIDPTSVRMFSVINPGDKGMRELTVRETQEVGGGVAPVAAAAAVIGGRAAFGAYVGGISYAATAATSGNWSWRQFGQAVTVGAITGAGAPLGAVGRYVVSRGAFYSSAAWGI